jgi:ABC-type molybdate transport system substrate-binding protein
LNCAASASWIGTALLLTIGAVITSAQSASQLNICHAGSLGVAVAEVEKVFSLHHPSISIKDISGGSLDLLRRLATGDLTCDVYASADHLNVDLFLKPAGLADYTIVLATGRIVLAYLANDAKAGGLAVSGEFKPPLQIPEVGPGWFETLLAQGVRIGVAHPFLDPGGYRSHVIFDLAQAFYKVPGLYNAALAHFAVTPTDADRPTLGTDINFQLTYEHNAARAARTDAMYRYAHLPAAIDLSDPEKEQVYARATVTVPGLGLPGTQATVTIPGSRAAWGVTIFKKTRNQENAELFVKLLLGPVGVEALKANGPTPLGPAVVSSADYRHLPPLLQPLVVTKR